MPRDASAAAGCGMPAEARVELVARAIAEVGLARAAAAMASEGRSGFADGDALAEVVRRAVDNDWPAFADEARAALAVADVTSPWHGGEA